MRVLYELAHHGSAPPSTRPSATTSGAAFSRSEMDQLLSLAEKGIAELVLLQQESLRN